MISLIIPSYRNAEYLDICLQSAIEQQENKNEIIVAIKTAITVNATTFFLEYKNDIKVDIP